MRHFPRLNRVAYGILRRRHSTVFDPIGAKRLLKACPRTGFLAGFRPPRAASHLLRVRLTDRGLCLSYCASHADFRLR
jgi:hypothetical protein